MVNWSQKNIPQSPVEKFDPIGSLCPVFIRFRSASSAGGLRINSTAKHDHERPSKSACQNFPFAADGTVVRACRRRNSFYNNTSISSLCLHTTLKEFSFDEWFSFVPRTLSVWVEYIRFSWLRRVWLILFSVFSSLWPVHHLQRAWYSLYLCWWWTGHRRALLKNRYHYLTKTVLSARFLFDSDPRTAQETCESLARLRATK